MMFTFPWEVPVGPLMIIRPLPWENDSSVTLTDRLNGLSWPGYSVQLSFSGNPPVKDAEPIAPVFLVTFYPSIADPTVLPYW